MPPKNIDATYLIRRLKLFGYVVARQKGSHIRIQTLLNGLHSETIPNHRPIKIGTLTKILSSIAKHHNLTRQELEAKLFS